MVAKILSIGCDCNAIHEKTIEKVKKHMPNDDVFSELIEFFKAFCGQTRMKILFALARDEMCVCDISVLLDMSKSAVSHQLKFLKKARLVKNKKVGKVVFYSLDDFHVKQIFELGLEHISEI